MPFRKAQAKMTDPKKQNKIEFELNKLIDKHPFNIQLAYNKIRTFNNNLNNYFITHLNLLDFP